MLLSQETVDQILAEIPTDTKIITYCDGLGCGRSLKVAEQLVTLGYTNVFRFKGGYDVWCEAQFYFALDGQSLQTLIDEGDQDYTLVNVTTPTEFNNTVGYITTSINVPLGDIQTATTAADLPDLPAHEGCAETWSEPIIIYCLGLGVRYQEAANALTNLGFHNVVVYAGGTDDWTNKLGNSLEK